MQLLTRLAWVLVFVYPIGLVAHSGGLDSLGCHHNRKEGGYHCHRGALAGRSFASKSEAERALQGKDSKEGARSVQTVSNPDVRVWVNTRSGVYHCPGTRWYGKTKEGTYMTQKAAQEQGYRPAYGNACN